MVEVLGFDFAPLNIPVRRRFQTFMVAWFMFESLFNGPFSFLLLGYLLIFTKYWYLTCAYAAWYVYDRNTCNRGGYKWTPLRNMFYWKYFAEYFPVGLVKTAPVPTGKNYIFTVHPHGILPLGVFVSDLDLLECVNFQDANHTTLLVNKQVNFATEANNFSQLYPGLRVRLLTLQEQFVLPIHREMISLTGAASATREGMEWLLTKEGKDNVLVLLPGGAAEALDAVPGTFDLTLSSRKGFCRMALKYGADLVPVLSFGENDVYSQGEFDENSTIRKFQKSFTKKVHFSPPLFYGRGIFQYTFGLIPYRKPITTVVGKPIEVVKTEGEPTKEEIAELHQLYCKTLNALYDEHKEKYGFKEVPMNIK